MKHFYDFLSKLIPSVKRLKGNENHPSGNGLLNLPNKFSGISRIPRLLVITTGICLLSLLVWTIVSPGQFSQISKAIGEEIKLTFAQDKQVEYTLKSPHQQWINEAGVSISTKKDLGRTAVTISHRAVTINQQASIRKVVGIHPEHDEDLDADLLLSYSDAELNGLDEGKLILFSSTDQGVTWRPHINSIVDPASNTIRVEGVRHFSLWTAALAPPPPDPGCIAGARLWLKANEGAYISGVTEATQGQKINIWKNWGTGANNAVPIAATHIPLLTDGSQATAMNYNPVINTNGKYFKIPGGIVGANTFTNLNVFAVTRSNSATNGAVLLNQTATNNSRIAALPPWGNGLVYWQAGNTGTLGQTVAYTNSGGTYATPYLWSFAANGTGTNNQAIIRNGTQLIAKNSAVSYTGSTLNTAYVGAYPGYGYFNGDIAEVMFFPTNISVADRHKIESYLAIKYGITLSHDYFASGGATTWDVGASGGFDNNITGIGRDDCSSLYQKQSRSINPNQFITIAAGSSIATSNANNAATISVDNSFLLWGDNNGSQTTTVAVTGSSNVFDRMARVWRVDKTSWADQNITFKAQGYGNRYLIIHNTSPTIGSAPDQEILLDATGSATFNSSLLPDGAYFSIGNLFKGPGCVHAGIGGWWRADNEASSTKWTDYSGNTHNATATGTPVYSTTGANFNPVLKFNNNYFTYANGIFRTTTNANMKVFSVMLPVNGAYNIAWAEAPIGGGNNHIFWAPSNNNYVYFNTPVSYSKNIGYTGAGGTYGVPNLLAGEKTPSNIAIRLNGKVFNFAGSYAGKVSNTANNHIGRQPLGVSSGANSGIAEVIVYRDASGMTPTDVQKIESYLAFKYGITLDQTAPRDYLAANGTTKMWDATANAAYKFNIAGIGRDDCQLLNQKQSKSVNAAQFITFAVGNTIATSNAANTTNIITDNSYLVWGDNAGSKTNVVAVSGVNVNERMSRVWRVDKTNWTDQDITIHVQGYGNRYFLVHNTDPAFGSAPSQEILLDPTGKATFNSSLLPDGAYFTLGNVLQGPGCVNAGIASWYDATEMPVGAMVEGIGWTDKSGWERDMTKIGAGRDPDVQEGMINFNRGAYFDGNDVVYQTSYGKAFTAGEVFSVGQAKDIYNRGPMYDFGGTPSSQGGHHYPWGNSALYEGFGTNDRVGYNPTSNAVLDGAPGLSVPAGTTPFKMTDWNLYNVGAATNDWFSGFNGRTKATRTINTPVFQTSSNNANGNQHLGWREGYHFYGNLAEVVHYNRKLTAPERQRVHSYLALKYGLTLDQTTPYNYVATDGSVYWDATANATFKYNIAGMGRDNCTKLDQKQSRSTNDLQFITMAIGNKVEASNTANANTITNDRSFLVWSDDNGSKTTSVVVSAANVTTRMQRVWKVDKTNWGDQNITFRAQGYPNRYLLIHNTSSTFASAPHQEIELNINGEATFNSSLLPDGAYFTIGAAVKGPGCVDVGVGSWWRADVDANAAGWNDYSGNEYNTTPVGTPTYTSTGANYNPFFQFYGNYFKYTNGIFKDVPGIVNMKVFSVVVPISGQFTEPWGENTNNTYNIAQHAPHQNGSIYFDAPYGHRITRTFASLGGTYNTPNIIASEKNATNMAIRLNGLVANQSGNYSGGHRSTPGLNYVGAQHTVATTGGSGVAEVIVYRDASAMTATDVQKIESYLALKYGITLDQTTPRDYLASNGTTKMWDATVNATFKYNIAGIGRDNCQGLHQRQSKSANVGQFITIATGPNIFPSNAEDSLNVTNDRSFLVWGDNNNLLTDIVAVNGVNVNERSARVWRVDKTNWADQDITFKAQGYANRFLLIHNTDPAFGTAPSQEIELDANGQATFSSSLLPDGAYFTLGNAIVGPGCVNAGVKYWIKSDYGANATDWTDYSGNENHAVAVGAPTLTGLMNFNPAYQYNNNSHNLPVTSNLVGNYSIFGMAKITGTSARVFQSQVGNALFGYWGGKENVVYFDANPNLLTGIASTKNTNLFSVQRSASGAWEFRGEGNTINSAAASANSTWRLNIGGKLAHNEPSQVLVPEVVAYNRDLTAAEVQRVESYFALKYGLTLDQTTPQNYLASDGLTKMWDAAANGGFKYNIAGIGRDKCSQLHQKQSMSSNPAQFMTIALGGSIEVDNPANPEAVTNDRSFLVWADDNGPKNVTVAVSGANVTERMSRVWRVSKTNWTDQDITFKATGFPNRYLLVHNTSSTFASAPDQEILLDATGQATFNSTALPDGAYFTIGDAVKGPGCVNAGVKVWLKTEFGLTVSGDMVTDWNDYSGNDANEMADAGKEPILKEANTVNFNFNSAVQFSGNQVMHFPTASTVVHNNLAIFTAALPVNNGTWNTFFRGSTNDHPIMMGVPGGGFFGYYDNVPAGLKSSGIIPSSTTPSIFGMVHSAAANTAETFVNGKAGNTLTNIDETGLDIQYFGNYQLGGQSFGQIAEVAVYNGTPTPIERQRIQSYFALKYGITLDQTTATDYLAADGVTKMWDAAANTVYKNNIAGLGRDDCQSLHQKQSKSANPAQFVTLSLGSSIATDNASNSESVTNDKSFLVWGDDGASLVNSIAVSGTNVTERMTRVWRVDKTNWDDQDITFRASLYPNRYLLIHNSSATFATAPDQEILLDANGQATFNSDKLPDGAYFTIGDAVKGPGCVNAGVKLWLRSDFMSAPNAWADYSGNAKDAAQVTVANQPTLSSDALNFNPGLIFDNVNDFLSIPNADLSGFPTGNGSRTAFTVAKLNTNAATDMVFSYGSNAANQSFTMGNNAGRAWYENWGGSYFGTPGGYPVNRSIINSWNHDNSVNPGSKGYIDGKQDWSLNPTLNTILGTNPLSIGRHHAIAHYLDGAIGEVIIYNRSLTAIEMQRVNSYLALKYGITLDQTTATDYLAADGVTKMWDATENAAYKNDIAGIGRDNCQGLHQKQSKSVNSDALVTMGYGNTIATDNASHTNPIETDKSFLVWGNDDGAINWQLTEAPTDRLRLTRKWRVDETGAVGSVKVRIPDNGSALSAKLPGEATTVYLLIDDDGDFTNATEVPMTLNTTDWEVDFDFSDGQYFTFATQIPPTPGCVVSGLQVWLKANEGTDASANGDPITSWLDQTVNNRDHTQTNVTWQPKFKANGFNFNPAVSFDGTDVMMTNAFASGNEAVHVFVMSKVNDNAFRALYGFNRDVTHVNWYNNGAANKPSAWLSAIQIPSTALGIDYGITTYILPKDGSQKTVHWNGTSANVGGNNTYAFSANKMGVGSDAANDGSSLSENFLGDIAEVIVYKTGSPTINGGRMTTNEIEKIESYLAIKYGVTLTHDYFAGGGGTIWDVGGSGGFDFNIAGIGRDDCQALNQKQSKSINANQFITFALGSNIADDNFSNEETIPNDNSFFVWGDDNGSKTTVVPVSGTNVTERMTRVWRVDKTNWEDQQITIQAQGFPNRYLIVSNSSASFATVDQEILLDVNGRATINSSSIPDGAYFTIGDAIKGPGCVNLGVKLWLRADQGTVTPTFWSDYSGQDNSPIGRGSATITTGAVNFNPAVTFAGAVTGEAYDFSTDLFTTGNRSIAVFSVGTGVGGTILSHGANVIDQAVHIRPSSATASFDFPSRAFTRGSIPASTRLMRNVYTAGTKIRGISFNGNAPTTNAVATLNWQPGGNGFRILGHDFISGNNKYNGNLPEMAVYFDVDLTPVQIQRIESYFALKYGITLDQTVPQDYLAGNGTTKMWDAAANATFNKNIAGLGRDNCQNLHQKQSKSVNASQFITFALGESIVDDNSLNAQTVTNDNSYFVWGDDNGSLTNSVAVSGTQVTERMERVWRVDKTNWNDQDVTIKIQGYPSRFLIIHNTSSSFASAPDQEIALDVNGEATFNTSLIPDGAYFTIGNAIKGPGCVNSGTLAWLRADYGLATGALWSDYSGNYSDFTQTVAGEQPSVLTGDASTNFNPAASFSSTKNLEKAAGLLTNAGGTVVAAVMHTNVTSVYSNIYNQNADNPTLGKYTGTANVALLDAGVHTANDISLLYTQGQNHLASVGYGNTANSYSVYLDGKGQNLATIAPSILAGIGYIGGDNTAESWLGNIYEVAFYNRKLNASELQRVHSYLALKYGITLDQTTPTDYLAGDGTTKMWDATLNAGFNHDIAGIGRDNCQELHQKQSRSVNADKLVTMGHGTIAVDNASNTNSITADKSFLVWGNNDGAIAWQFTETPATNRMRITREWRVQETGTIGSMKVSVPDDSSPLSSKMPTEAYPVYLLVDADGDFSTGATEVTMTLNGTDWEAEYDFNDGDYFTFSTEVPPAPGCVVPNLGLWLAANKGVTGDPTVTAWEDQTLNLSPITVVGAPQITATINFNPAIALGTGKYFTTPNASFLNPISNKVTLFAVTKPTSTGVNPIISKTINAGWDDGFGMYGNVNQKIGFWQGNQTGSEPANVPHQVYPSGRPFISTGYYDTNQKVSVNGQAAVSAVQTPLSSTSQVEIGFAKTFQFTGDYAEVILYNDDIGAAGRDKVESYLAVKYGITLAHDYFAGDGTLLWDLGGSGGYDNNITGIGRDDCDLLNQKQSKSVNSAALVTVGNGNTIAASNADNSNDFSENVSFLLFGDNNGAVSWQVAESPAQRRRLTREWRVNEVGTVGSVKIQVPDNSSALGTKLPAEVSAVYLLVDADGDFSSGATEIAMTLNGTDWEADVDLENGQYFSIATNLAPQPGCIATNTSLWLRADLGFTPATWTDQSGSANNATQATGANQPALASSANYVNFNPAVDFDGVNDIMQVPASALGTNASQYTFFSVVSADGNGSLLVQEIDACSNAGVNPRFTADGDLNWHSSSCVGSPAATGGGLVTTGAVLNAADRNSGTSLGSTWRNGTLGGTLTRDFNSGDAEEIWIGGRVDGTPDNFNGRIAEMVLYGTQLTTVERHRVESYLAVKYGITLSHDYLNGANVTIWDIGNTGGYDNDIAGIGRDDCADFNQKQSKSVNGDALITMGNGNTIAVDNPTNSSSFTVDASHMLWGNNDGAIAWQETEAPAQRQRLTREWLIAETNTIGSVKVRIPDNSSALATKLPAEVLSVYLIVDNDGDFSSGAIEIPMSLNGTNWEVDYDFLNGEYFTFGTETCAPIITTNPVSVILCAGGDATFTVAALGPNLTYQWQEDTGSGFANIPGATSASFTKTGVSGAMNGYQYQAIVYGICMPEATSTVATMTVNTPPTITTQPVAATVCAGTDATFTVVATGTDVTYQWQENAGLGFVNIAGATSASFTKTSTTVSMSGYEYQVVISGVCSPIATSIPVALTVDAAPTISTQPADVTICAGTDATFTVVAAGTGLTYQWQENNGSGFVDIPGATSASFTKTGTTGAMDGYFYQVVVSGNCTPAVTSNSVELTVNTSPAITTQPSAATVCAGSDATFTVVATGTGLLYQWQEDSGSGFANIAGANSASYTKASTTAAMNGYQYQVIVSGTCMPPVTSAPVALTVNTAPAISTHPASSTVCAGSDATFTVVATGTNLTYQWQEDAGSGFVDIAGATNASYTKTSTTALMDGYEYQVIVSGACPSPLTSTVAELTVNTLPGITTQPSAVTVCAGSDATFTVVATGTGLLYQWQEDSGSGFANIAGANSASYTKASTTAAMNGYQYQVIVSGTCMPPVTSAPVALTVNTAPAISTHPASSTVCAGSDATFTVVATGTDLTYQWQEDAGSGFVDIAGATNASYTKASTTALMDGYEYQVIVSGACPSPLTSTVAELTVNTLPGITTQPSAVTVCAGSDATFTVVATGTGLLYQWQEDSGSGFANIAGANSASYTKASTTAGMNGYQYQVIVSGTCMPPVTSAPVSLTVNTAPAITAQPMAATVCEGQNATYTVTATGTGITYQWQEDSGGGFMDIPGATSSSYTRTAATSVMNGNQFHVIISGICPVPVTSTDVALNVDILPGITDHPASLTACEGNNATFTVVATGTGLMYQWQVNTGSGYANIAGATSDSYTAVSIAAAMNGYQYRVIVSGTCMPPVTSNAALLTVNTAPVISIQPASQAVCAGNDATFTVTATGAALTYQWQENTGSGFANIAGATSASYTKSSTNVSMNGYQYRVIINGVCPPQVTSNIATLTVNTLPAITTHPNNVSTCEGNNAIFTVSGTGSGLTYQWQENTGSGFVNISGATGSLFIKSSVTAAMNAYQYRVILSGTCPPSVTSNPATLTVNSAPAITVQPAPVVVCETSNATFTVTATGSGLTYQWQENTGSGFVDISGATSASYTKNAVTGAMNGYLYQVVVSGTCAPSVTSGTALLTVTTAPAITSQPNDLSICAGANAVFSVTTTGAGLAYQWQVNDGFGFVDIPGAGNATYTKVAAPASFNGYQYRVIVGGVCPPSVTSNVVTLTIQSGPSIVSQPSSLTACVGSSASFNVVAVGPGLTYQWQENTGMGFVNISGANSDSYTKSGITAGMNGYSYRVLVSGTCAPTVTSDAAVMAVEAPPMVTTQPANAAVCEGANATFTVVATGTGLTYQWQEDSGSGFANISGATSASFTKPSVLTSMNGYKYKVIVTGACSPPATSNEATLTVNSAPAITTQPADQIHCEGANAIFSVVATGPGLSYQWEMNTGSGFAPIAGATNSAFTEPSITPAMDGRQYRVVVSGTCSPAATSNAAFLTVNTPPAITTQPLASTTCAGSNATFTVVASGAGLTYQWQENTGSGYVNIAGATSATYVKSSVTPAMNGYLYRVNIAGTCPPSVTSSAVALTVIEAPVITSQPSAVTLCAGANATFNVTATGAGLTYQWEENDGFGFVAIAGATSASYTKTAVTSAVNGYQYRVIVSGDCLPLATSNHAVLTVNTAPAITAQPIASTVCAGADATFTVSATGTGLTYQWQEDAGLGFANIAGATSASYTVTAATSMNGYLYRVIISGTCSPSVTSNTVALTVNDAPNITTQPVAETVCPGDDATFSVVASGAGLTYQWQENDGSGYADILGATSASYTKLSTNGSMDGNLYRVVVSGTCLPAATSNGALLTVDASPTIGTQPSAITVCAGVNATFNVVASGTGLTYQWQEDSGSGFANIAGATGASYTKVAPAVSMNGYQYQVIISGVCAPPVTSTPVALTVNAAPSITTQPASTTVDEGMNASFAVVATGVGLTYQWQEDQGVGFADISGATAASYTKMAVTTAMDGYKYRVVITGTCSPSVTSDEAVLNVTLTSPVLAVKAYLGAAYVVATDRMHDKLRVANMIPNAQPYNGADYSDFAYNGTETIGAGVLSVSGDNAIVDWVLLELRDAANPATIVARKAALIQRDGDVVSSTDGVSSVTFTGAPAGDYYVALRHRNHLGVMTMGSLSLSGLLTSIDFTSTSTSNYQLPGANGSPHAQELRTNNKLSLWGGNYSKSGNTGNRLIYQGNDSDPDEVYYKVLLDLGNTNVLPNYIVVAYDRADGNLDGNVIYQGDDSDEEIPFFSVLLFPSNTSGLPNFVVYQQIP